MGRPRAGLQHQELDRHDVRERGRELPRCGAIANVISGTYDFIGDVVRMVRASDLTLDVLREAKAAAEAARASAMSAEAFATANPRLAPIVNVIVEQKGNRDWLAIFIAVLTLMPYLVPEPADAPPTPPTTRSLSDDDVERISGDVAQRLAWTSSRQAPPRRERGGARKKRPAKTHGRDKRRR
jgi:hypothetical protein